MKKFALIGAAGYVAPRHFAAISKTGNELVAAFDPCDSVGVIDRTFPSAAFFVEFERFDRHLDKLKRNHTPVDYVTVCSPNYLHDSHIRFGLRNNAHVICEKPVVLNPWNLDAIASIENTTGNSVYSILQLRLHPAILQLREKIANAPLDKKYDIDLTYITPRGNWYYASWKGDVNKSGGIATNIGIHFFDMLCWIFGAVQKNIVHVHTHDRAAGLLELERANIRWFLSINPGISGMTEHAANSSYRQLSIEGESIDFSSGFEALHTLAYQQILSGEGFGINDSKAAVHITHDIRHLPITRLEGDYHPLAKLPLSKHPFYR